MTTNRRTRRIAASLARAAIPQASAQLRSVVKAAYERFDRAFARRIEADAQPSTISCQPGCAACCQQSVLLTWVEADLIVSRHRSVVAELLPELDRQNGVMLELGAERRSQTIADASEDAAQSLLRQRWSKLGVPCAFLEQSSQRCRIYASRPLACRAHAVTSPPEACKRSDHDAAWAPGATPYGAGPEYSEAQLALMRATADALGGTVVMGHLPGLLARAFRESARGTWQVDV